jgi:hypothetical protein
VISKKSMLPSLPAIFVIAFLMSFVASGSAFGDDAVQPAEAVDSASVMAPGEPAPDAQASGRLPYRLVGRNWPVRTIPVWNRGKGFTGKVLRKAMQLWNRSGARIRFRMVRRPGARVVEVRTDRRLNGGKATAGYVRRGSVIAYPGPRRACPVRGRYSRKKYIRLVRKRCPWVKIVTMKRGGGIVWLQLMGRGRVPEYFRVQVMVTVHELGHIIGLGHRDTACLVMNTKPRPGCGYSRRNPVKVMCQIPMPGDVAGAVRRYGGHVAIRRPRHLLCDKFRKPGRPGLVVTAEKSGILGLVVKLGSLPPPYRRAGMGGRVTVMVTPKSPCPYRKGARVAPLISGSYLLDQFWLGYRSRRGKKIGRVVKHPAASFPGASLCVAAYVDDRFARRSRLSNPVQLSVRG